MTTMKFIARLRRGTPEKVGVRFRVIADDVAALECFAQKFRMLAGVLADDEECGVRFVAVEKIEQLRGDHGIRTVIEGNGEFARRICMRDCGTENF